MAPEHENGDRRSQYTYLMKYAGMGFELAAGIAGFVVLGWLWDRYRGSGKIGVITGAVVGAVGGFTNFIRQAVELARETERRSRPRHSDSTNHDHDEPTS